MEFEKQKFIDENYINSEIRRIENEEKRLIMTQIENYYKDKISMLKDILKKEKHEKEVQYRAQIQFFSKLDREKKQEFKKEVDRMFVELEEMDKKQEFRDGRNDKVLNVLEAYYK